MYEFKIIALDRKTGARLTNEIEVAPSIEINAQRYCETFLRCVGLDDGITFAMGVVASMLGEMFGADVYYRPKGFDAWKVEFGKLPRGAISRTREIAKQAGVVVEVLTSVDNRALATDGPVTPTIQEIRGDEFRKLYVAAKAMIKACDGR
jgi:hypothetical protein